MVRLIRVESWLLISVFYIFCAAVIKSSKGGGLSPQSNHTLNYIKAVRVALGVVGGMNMK